MVIELEKAIKLKTVEIRKVHRIKHPDAIIAATAQVYKLTLITKNVEDFKNIAGLVIVNPWKSNKPHGWVRRFLFSVFDIKSN